MLPITGPFTETVGSATSGTYFNLRQRYKQKRPIDRPLAYKMYGGRQVSKSGLHQFSYAPGNTGWGYANQNPLKIVAYDRFKDEVQPTASMGVSLLEFSQSYGMLTARLLQMYQFGKRLRRFDFKGAAEVLQMPKPPKGAKTSKKISSNYLEFHFGWSPLVGDIYSAIDVLQNPINSTHVRASAHGKYSYTNTPPGTSPVWTYDDWEERVVYGATVSVANPNLNLANQLGLTNPLVWAYEVIPFSFVADWFFNVEQFLLQSTDFMGLTMKNTYTTLARKGTRKQGYPYDTRLGYFTAQLWMMDRILGIDKPSFGLRAFKPFGLRRSLAAASLLALQLKSF